MARRSRELGIIKACVLGAALAAGLATAAQADDKKLTLTGSAMFVTDYMFRSVSQTSSGPAVQPEFDLTYGIFYAYIWGSNVNVPGAEGIEIDYGAGITPKWRGITFNFAALEYTYPGGSSLDYLELRSSAAYTFGEKLTLSIGNWWSPDNFGVGTQSDAVEFGAAYVFSGKLFNFFSPSISGAVGEQFYETNLLGGDYTYWNAGLTLGFMDHWSADIRYYDTNYSEANCFTNIGARDSCDARVVGALKATF
jgi:uncharacterized protein (TIGR02001 family)